MNLNTGSVQVNGKNNQDSLEFKDSSLTSAQAEIGKGAGVDDGRQEPTVTEARLTKTELTNAGQTNISEIEKGSIVLTNVSKAFRKASYKKTYNTFKSFFVSKPKNQTTNKETSQKTSTSQDASSSIVLENFNLHIKPGTAFGVIGRNGSGKSTLLKLISGIYRPDSGTVTTVGRLSALIELGAGFHPDFTGRENIYLGGAMYGLTRKEIKDKLPKIIAYAELEDFIDAPVRTYSSGMYMRLGFSLAIHSDPDILLVDEVLAVGDTGFVHRCHDSISELKRQGKTLLLVTHDLNAVEKWCDEAIWLNKGKVLSRGEPRLVIEDYLTFVAEEEEKKISLENAELLESVKLENTKLEAGGENNADGNSEIQTAKDGSEVSSHASDNLHRWGNRDVEITNVRMLTQAGQESWIFKGDEPVSIEVEFQINKKLEEKNRDKFLKDLVFGIGILRADGFCLHGTNTDIDQICLANFEFQEGRGKFIYQIEKLLLLENSYYLDVAAHREDGLPYDYHHLMYKFSVRGLYKHHGVYLPDSHWKVKG